MREFRPFLLIYILFFIFFSFSFLSCTKDSTSLRKKARVHVVASDDLTQEKASVIQWNRTTQLKTLIVLGNHYNSDHITAALEAEFGSEELSGAVFIRRYPDDFKIDGISRISLLADFVQELNIDILVTAGIPEGSMNAFNKVRETRKTSNSPIYIANILPFEKSLVMEAVSDLVIEPKIDETMAEDETSVELSEQDIGQLLLATILASPVMHFEQNGVLPGLSPSERCELLKTTIKKIQTKETRLMQWDFTPYIDPITTLKSYNHLVFSIQGL